MNLICSLAILFSLLLPIQSAVFADATPRFSLAEAAAAITQQQPQAQAETVDSLRSRISAHISQAIFDAAQWGIKVVSLETGKTVFEHKSTRYFNPASNAKLFTAALALNHLGADYRIRTSLYSKSRPDASGVIKGDLIVYGRGDPTMAARLNGGDYYKPLEPLAAALASAGVKRIEGDLVGDESWFKGPPFGSGWQWDDLQWYYGAEVSALSVNDNSVDLFAKPAERAGMQCRITTGPITGLVTVINRTQTAAKVAECKISVYRPLGENVIYVSGCVPLGGDGFSGSVAAHNPANLFVTLFREMLERRGITVIGRVRTVDWKYREVIPVDLAKLVELGSVESLPLRDIVRETLKPSQNLYAQLLLLQVGASFQHGAAERMSAAGSRGQDRADRTTEEAGIEAMNSFLAEVGVKKGDVLLEEGSGLSRRDIITPDAVVALLVFMSRHRWADVYRDSLPIAGVDGTLKTRMKGTAATGNVRAKTGSLRFVNALSGYATTAAGERLAFSILLNNYYGNDQSPPARDIIDGIAAMLASFTGHT